MSTKATELVCGECGTTNQQGEDFCGECGAYLEWEGTPVAVEPEPVAEEPTTEAPKTVVERVKAAVGLGPDDEAPAPVTAEQHPEKTTQAAPEPTVAAVLPGTAAPKPRRRPSGPQDIPIQPGDLICGKCGAGNKPTRKFCRRCGGDLAEAEVARVPWWRRPFVRKPRQGPEAGTRPVTKKPRRLPSIAKYVAILLVLAGLVFLSRPLWSPAYEAIVDRVRNVEPVTPDSFNASSSAQGHPPQAVRDGATNVYWAPDTTGDAKGEFIEARFDEPIRLVYVRVKTGVGQKDAEFLNSGRPTELRITIFTKDGEPEQKTIDLVDKPAFQEERLATSDVTRVRFTILASEPGRKADSRVSIAELEFFQRQ